MGNWLGNIFGGAPQNAATITGPFNSGSSTTSGSGITGGYYPGGFYQTQTAFSHEQLLEQHFAMLLRERKFSEWVREKKRRDTNASAPGYFEPVPQCVCAWCALTELERQVALAKASETP